MTSDEHVATLHPIVAFRAKRHIELCASEGIDIFVTQSFRSWPEQAAIYAKGRTAPGEPCRHGNLVLHVGSCAEHPLGATVTNARPGWSWHTWLGLGKGLAYDVAIRDFPGDTTPNDVYDGPWSRVGLLGEGLGMNWGGRWKSPDLPHFDEPLGFTLAGLVRAYPGGAA